MDLNVNSDKTNRIKLIADEFTKRVDVDINIPPVFHPLLLLKKKLREEILQDDTYGLAK